jgi:hypothetical protein
MLGIGVTPDLSTVALFVASGGERDGQHSGLSSLQPTRGTSITAPPRRASVVYCGMLHVPTKIAWPVYAAVGSRIVVFEADVTIYEVAEFILMEELDISDDDIVIAVAGAVASISARLEVDKVP